MFDDRFSFGRGFGPGGFGPGFGLRRFFERGDLKLVILHLIKEKPRHGYDVIQELEDKFHGFYNPSAGSVYPILQLLEDQDFVSIEQKDGKKVYSITSEGEKYLQEHTEELKRMDEKGKHFREHFGSEIHNLRGEIHQIMQLIFQNAADGAMKDPQTLKQLRTALDDFRKTLETIFSKRKEREKTKEK